MRSPAPLYIKQIVTILLIIGLLLGTACRRGLPIPIDTRSVDSNQDHLRIASYYTRQAMTSRQKAEEQASLALVYGRLFGYDSEWVSGAQLLTQFYEEVAREQDRQASLHLELAGRRPSSQ
jgi:hypothetical protein